MCVTFMQGNGFCLLTLNQCSHFHKSNTCYTVKIFYLLFQSLFSSVEPLLNLGGSMVVSLGDGAKQELWINFHVNVIERFQ